MGLYTANVKSVTLAAATVKSLIVVASSSGNRNRLVEWGISFDGTNAANAPVAVDLLRTTTAGTSSGGTVIKLDPADAAAESTVGITVTVEGTVGDILEPLLLTPNGGLFVKQYPLGREPLMATSSWLAIRCNAPAVVNATAYMVWEEF